MVSAKVLNINISVFDFSRRWGVKMPEGKYTREISVRNSRKFDAWRKKL